MTPTDPKRAFGFGSISAKQRITVDDSLVMKQGWKDLAELIGIAAIVASLLFVALQMRQAQDIAYSDLDLSLLSIQAETANLIATNPKIWVEGNAGGELNAAESAVFNEIIVLLNNRWFVEHRHAARLGRTDIAEGIVHDWSAFLYENPGARQVWQEREDNLHRVREILRPGEGDKWSFWSEKINIDLARLDASHE